jgi:hypothetical protein
MVIVKQMIELQVMWAFHLDALFDGKETILLYDSILTINNRKEATSGAIRVAKRIGSGSK